LEKLVRGLHQFQQTYFDTNRALFERLVHGGQRPETLFITCSDSRINPNLLTQTRPGDLFIIRLAGNLVPAHGASSGGEAATIEYAVAALGVKDIIVCGHSHCGAMEALFDDQATEGLPQMRAWLGHAAATRRIIEENYADRGGEARLKAATEENVLVQLENLRTHPVVAARLARGELHLHGWVYKIETGEVFAFEPLTGQFLPLSPGTPPALQQHLGAAADTPSVTA
jgi:carbonic anhydrase